MSHFSAFRHQILATLAAAGVAQACGGTVTDSSEGSGGGGTPSGPNQQQDPDPPLTLDPGCIPVTTVEERLARAEGACGGVACTRSDYTECLAPADLEAVLRECTAPLEAGRCPAAADLIFLGGCGAYVGEAELVGAECCYPATHLSCAVPGRPLQAGGDVVLPAVVVGEAIDDASARHLEPAARRLLADLWCEGARFEYASVASFARSTFQLMALGAPADLVRASQEASLDEIEHARLCFDLASRFRGRRLGPGPLPAGWDGVVPELVDFAVENVIGGCVGETVSALMAVEQLEVATDPEVRAALATIAADETRHAMLAWRIAAWAAEVGGERVRERMAVALHDALAEPAPRIAEATAESDALEGLGRLSPRREWAIRARVLGEVVAPCAEWLLAA